MSTFEIFLTAIALSMDAFAVAVCKGLSLNKKNFRLSALTGLYFGGFQALMPVIGFFLAGIFSDKINSFDHWIAFILLGIIGANMIKESRDTSCEVSSPSFSFVVMTGLAIATSIDALAVGVTYSFLKVNILYAAIITGITTFVISTAGVYIGNIFGAKYKSKAEFAGGLVLVLLGTKILLQHLGIL